MSINIYPNYASINNQDQNHPNETRSITNRGASAIHRFATGVHSKLCNAAAAARSGVETACRHWILTSNTVKAAATVAICSLGAYFKLTTQSNLRSANSVLVKQAAAFEASLNPSFLPQPSIEKNSAVSVSEAPQSDPTSPVEKDSESVLCKNAQSTNAVEKQSDPNVSPSISEKSCKSWFTVSRAIYSVSALTIFGVSAYIVYKKWMANPLSNIHPNAADLPSPLPSVAQENLQNQSASIPASMIGACKAVPSLTYPLAVDPRWEAAGSKNNPVWLIPKSWYELKKWIGAWIQPGFKDGSGNHLNGPFPSSILAKPGEKFDGADPSQSSAMRIYHALLYKRISQLETFAKSPSVSSLKLPKTNLAPSSAKKVEQFAKFLNRAGKRLKPLNEPVSETYKQLKQEIAKVCKNPVDSTASIGQNLANAANKAVKQSLRHHIKR